MPLEKLLGRLVPDPRNAPSECRPRDPSFIGIGMPSSGTRWLHDQLAAHRDVWMPCQKELHFFDRGMRTDSARKRLNMLLPWFTTRHKLLNLVRQPIAGLGVHAIDDTQIEFLNEYLLGPGSRARADIEAITRPTRDEPGVMDALIENPGLDQAHFDQYRRLFGYHRKSYCGEITPKYCYLAPDYIAEICAAFPQTRFILIVRDPVERQLSGWKKRVRLGKASLKETAPATAGDTGEPSASTEPEARTSDRDPCSIADRWESIAGTDRLLTIRFRDIVDRPAETRRRVAAFLDLPAGERGFRIRPDYNRKQQKPAEERLSSEQVQAMHDHLSSRLQAQHRQYVERFGGE